jgi:hypothetical protein
MSAHFRLVSLSGRIHGCPACMWSITGMRGLQLAQASCYKHLLIRYTMQSANRALLRSHLKMEGAEPRFLGGNRNVRTRDSG